MLKNTIEKVYVIRTFLINITNKLGKEIIYYTDLMKNN